MTVWKALRSLFRRDPPPLVDLDGLQRRIEALEASQADCNEVVQLEAERAARWADMSQQLRRFLGRLDAHAGKDKSSSEENGARGLDPKQLAAVLRTKFPNAGG